MSENGPKYTKENCPDQQSVLLAIANELSDLNDALWVEDENITKCIRNIEWKLEDDDGNSIANVTRGR